jgi:hypothetical protein
MEPNEYLVHDKLRLARGSLLRIEDGREMLVHARDGCVWITQEGEGRDVLLEAGAADARWFRRCATACSP